ncbi:transporter [Actinobacillus delphinicola]|uniref:Molybdenum-pterin-binding protein II n=1 Tax=Actinobacillus delphinicola TaxID=51161 RepID=A0A448TTY2_9PAST|nr:molybdopterin-binding protein [Actinobacillus delphinicola]MDG6897474.1 transporter [Actinobacillus delphinicola]VEJ09301.1 Molybdenum-pterin-binding protein II [Actinobacillus delphinicola]
MKFSTRNLIKGTVTQITEGAVNVEVTIKTAEGVELVSIITKAACDNLGLAVGKEAYAAIKASNVMIGIDE